MSQTSEQLLLNRGETMLLCDSGPSENKILGFRVRVTLVGDNVPFLFFLSCREDEQDHVAMLKKLVGEDLFNPCHGGATYFGQFRLWPGLSSTLANFFFGQSYFGQFKMFSSTLASSTLANFGPTRK